MDRLSVENLLMRNLFVSHVIVVIFLVFFLTSRLRLHYSSRHQQQEATTLCPEGCREGSPFSLSHHISFACDENSSQKHLPRANV